MKKETLKRIFNFLEEKEEHNAPFKWKILNNEPITKEDLNVKGDLILTYSDIELLPEGLNVRGDLDLFGSELTSLPKGLKVGAYLDIRYTKITSLPKGLEVGDFFMIGFTPIAKYSDEELREMIKPGFIKGQIERD